MNDYIYELSLRPHRQNIKMYKSIIDRLKVSKKTMLSDPYYKQFKMDFRKFIRGKDPESPIVVPEENKTFHSEKTNLSPKSKRTNQSKKSGYLSPSPSNSEPKGFTMNFSGLLNRNSEHENTQSSNSNIKADSFQNQPSSQSPQRRSSKISRHRAQNKSRTSKALNSSEDNLDFQNNPKECIKKVEKLQQQKDGTEKEFLQKSFNSFKITKKRPKTKGGSRPRLRSRYRVRVQSGLKPFSDVNKSHNYKKYRPGFSSTPFSAMSQNNDQDGILKRIDDFRIQCNSVINKNIRKDRKFFRKLKEDHRKIKITERRIKRAKMKKAIKHQEDVRAVGWGNISNPSGKPVNLFSF
ncbi:unnamed protein product [Moneuplotes crassus]|uniref:Uncharacterized protein n=1 Tax=Euplotes crassus TaxID=5936 RepID=A0AAD1X4I9_EUPCR|nr:unnamed protein product [Moneuplotes crassus]